MHRSVKYTDKHRDVMSRFIKPTKLRLPNDEIARHATWLEIFFDLIFAVIVFQLSERLLHQLNITGILDSTALFIPVMWTWASYTVFAARFDNDDSFHWLMTFIIIFAGIIMAMQIRIALENGANYFATGFLIAQITLLLLYSRSSFDNLAKDITRFYLIGYGLGGLCWLISLMINPPFKFILWITGMGIYLSIPWLGRTRLSKAPLDSSYIPERFGAFTIIILGQIIASVVFGLESATLSFASVITSILAFILAIIIWGQYYRFNLIADYKCTIGSGQSYIYLHIPLIMSLIIIGVCTQEFITNPLMIHKNVNPIICFAIIIYLVSFYFLQYIAIKKFKIRSISYISGIAAIFILFFLNSLPSVLMMLIITMIFASLFCIQYFVEKNMFIKNNY